MKHIYLGILLLVAPSMHAVQFNLGSSEADLKALHKHDTLVTETPNLITFRVDIASLNVVLTYRLRDGKATSLSGTVAYDEKAFASALTDFANLVSAIDAEGKPYDTELRVGGIWLAGPMPTKEDSPNYLRVSGRWKPGFVFTATLEGSDKERSVERCIVTRFGFVITPEVKPSGAPL